MSYRILLTCPPFIKRINFFQKKFKELNFEVYAPEFEQTLTESELINLLPKYDGWIIGDDPVTEKVLIAGTKGKFKAAVKWGIGIDNINFEAANNLNLDIQNTPGMFGAEVADLAIAYTLGLARDAFYIDREVRKGNWVKPTGISMQGKTIGILGLGDIGKSFAKRIFSHECNIIGWDPNAKNLDSYIDLHPWPNGISRCDFLVFCCALNSKTKNIFDYDILEKCKDGIRIVNVSRGPLIDESVLIKGLKSSKIKSVALDVFVDEPLSTDHALLDYENCILGSHNASNTAEAVDRTSLLSLDLLHNKLKEKK